MNFEQWTCQLKKNPERTDILFTNKYSTPPETHSKEELASFFRGAIATVLFACADVNVEKSNRKKRNIFNFIKGPNSNFLKSIIIITRLYANFD